MWILGTLVVNGKNTLLKHKVFFFFIISDMKTIVTQIQTSRNEGVLTEAADARLQVRKAPDNARSVQLSVSPRYLLISTFHKHTDVYDETNPPQGEDTLQVHRSHSGITTFHLEGEEILGGDAHTQCALCTSLSLTWA